MSDVTVTLTRYDEPDWLVIDALSGLAKQQDISLTVLFLDQSENNEIDDEIARLEKADNVDIRRQVIPRRSLSYARNTAIKEATTDIVLFVDADAIPQKGWAAALAKSLSSEDAAVAIAGGRVLPKWHRRPPMLTQARIVSEQYSLLDFGEDTKEVAKIVGAGFGIRRDRFTGEMWFDDGLGRRSGKLFGGEETDLCKRVRNSGGKVIYNGQAAILHQILPDRANYRWMMRRMYYAGYSRAARGGTPSPTHRMEMSDFMALPFVLPPYLLGMLACRIGM